MNREGGRFAPDQAVQPFDREALPLTFDGLESLNVSVYWPDVEQADRVDR